MMPLRLVPAEPTEAMVARALLNTDAPPQPQDQRLALNVASAIPSPLEVFDEGIMSALDVVRDYRACLSAAPDPLADKGLIEHVAMTLAGCSTRLQWNARHDHEQERWRQNACTALRAVLSYTKEGKDG